jgi:hypothetical protein
MTIPVPYQIGKQISDVRGKILREEEDETAIGNILKRAQQTDANVEDLFSTAMRIKDPQKRQSAMQYAESLTKRQKEASKNAEVRRIISSDNPLEELKNSPIDLDTKSKIMDHLFQGSFLPELGVFSKKPSAAPQQKDLDEPVGLENQIGEIDRTPKKVGLSNATPEQLNMALSNPKMRPWAQAEITARKDDRDFRFKNDELYRKNYQTKMIDLGNKVNQTETDMQAIEQAVADNDSTFWTAEGLKSFLGVEEALLGPGGQINSAVKNFFMEDIKGLGVRANQFMERMLKSALTASGQTKSAQLIISRMMRNRLEGEKAENRVRRDLFEKNRDKLETGQMSYGSLELEVGKSLGKIKESNSKKMMNDLIATQTIYDKNIKSKFVPVDPGTRISQIAWRGILRRNNGDKEKSKEEAMKLGYNLK